MEECSCVQTTSRSTLHTMFAETNPAILFLYVVRYIPDTPPRFCTASDVKLGGVLGMRPGEEYSSLLG